MPIPLWLRAAKQALTPTDAGAGSDIVPSGPKTGGTGGTGQGTGSGMPMMQKGKKKKMEKSDSELRDRIRKGKEDLEKVTPGVAARVIRAGFKPADAGKDSDIVPGGPGSGAGSGEGSPTAAPKSPDKKIKKGGPGSGRRGHSSSRPVERLTSSPIAKEDVASEMAEAKKMYGEPEVRGDSTKFKDEEGNTRIEIMKDWDKYILRKGGPGSGRKGHMGVTPSKSVRERNRQKAGEAIQSSRDAKRIIAELGLGKEDLKEIRDYASAEGISPSQFIVNNKDHIKTNLKKGGPGSGRKAHFMADGYEHESLVEQDMSPESTREKLEYRDRIKEAADRMEEQYASAERSKGKKQGVSRKGPSQRQKLKEKPKKPGLLSRIGQKIIDAI